MKITFVPTGGQAKSPPDPAYPKGLRLDLSQGARQTCTAPLQYPAPCIGLHMLACEVCGFSGAVTAAGRPDDPLSVRVACKLKGSA